MTTCGGQIKLFRERNGARGVSYFIISITTNKSYSAKMNQVKVFIYRTLLSSFLSLLLIVHAEERNNFNLIDQRGLSEYAVLFKNYSLR